MKYILIALPVLASVASAEIMGTYYEPASPAPASGAASVVEASQQASSQAPSSTASASASGEYTVSAATSTEAVAPTQTPVVASSSWAYTEEVPYWHMTKDGYQQMGCGYGYYKDTKGYCQPESWVCTVLLFHFGLVADPWVGLQYNKEGGCYETVILNQCVTSAICPRQGIDYLDLSQEEVLCSKSRDHD